MDAPIRSGSYSRRTANPPLQTPPDGYPQKRTSYRRPIDPQPTPTEPLPPNTVPSNSARQVAAASGANGVSRSSSHRRRASQNIPPPAIGAGEGAIPAAPDAPRGPPPTSYRDPYAPKGSSRPSRTYSGRSRDPAIQVNSSRQQPNVQIPNNRLQELRPGEPLSATVEGLGRRPSVPDRSPLQKLEGKLDDISKEEKRARMLELELAAQERAEAEARARRAAAKQQRNVSGPLPDADKTGLAPVRTANSRRHVSMPQQPKHKSPVISDIDSDDGLMYDLSEPWDPEGAGPKGVMPIQPRGASTSGSQRNKTYLTYTDGAVDRTPSVKGKEPVGVKRGSGSFRERAAGGPRSDGKEQKVHRKPVGNNSPAGLGLYDVDGAVHPSKVGRQDSKRVTKDLPPVPIEAIPSVDRRRDSRGIMAAQMEKEQHRLDSKNNARSQELLRQAEPPVTTTRAPTARRSVGFASSVPDPEPAVPHKEDYEAVHADVFHNDQPDRRYVPSVMLNEWRNAPTALLVAEDLDLDAAERSGSTKKAWWEESTSTRRRRSGSHSQGATTYDGYADEPSSQTSFNPPLYLQCGPLLRYTGITRDKSRPGKERETWRGSVMIVTTDSQSNYQRPPTLRLFTQPMDLLPPPPAEIDEDGQPLNPAYIDPLEGQTKVSRSGKTLYVRPIDEIAENVDLSRVEDDSGLFQQSPIPSNVNGKGTQKGSRIRKKDGEKLGKVKEIPGIRLHAERGVTFWRFNLQIELGPSQSRIAYRINRGPAIGFWVPARGETMNMMFHSCNGFSLSVDAQQFCGPDPMWRDVLNNHQTRPFHVMIGGGDQIYNDAAMRDTTLFKQWTLSRNPYQKHNCGFSAELQNELEQFYLDRYSMWFSQGLFGMANSQIPMINIWDDHDIIDGYGSYPHHFMSTPVFTGLGAVAFKYYMLFQHQSVPAETATSEPSWLLGAHPGPYIKQQSRSVFMSLGRHVAFLGLDCRTERQRDEILTEDSYDVIFDRLEAEIIKGETKHLIVLLGVPIAYPRLNFLENVLTSRFMDPIKALGRTGVLGGFVNKFDGGVEILDDLDDHWTAKHHKDERNWLVKELQHIASTKSVRITILGGDVHLAAVGQFYTNKKLNIPKDKDHRYMPNIVSSAIVNTPPPEMMADILNKRNKVHHLDDNTDEDMIPLFTHDTDGRKRNNNHLLPRRNWCSMREYKPGTTPLPTPTREYSPGDGGPVTRRLSDSAPGKLVRRLSGSRRGRQSGPPMSYYNNPAYAAAEEDQAGVGVQSSFSPERSERPRSRRHSLTSLFRRRGSTDSINPPGSAHSLPTPRRTSTARDEFAERPSPFHRRPSILGKKGMERDGAFVNLEGGLDICLNLEVSQKDPAGITTPYRLLVPALDYLPPEEGIVEAKAQRRKSRMASIFGAFGGGKKDRRTIGDDGYSHSGSDVDSRSAHSSELGEVEVDDEERARQRYKVGPRILIPSFTKKRDSTASGFADPRSPTDRRASTAQRNASLSGGGAYATRGQENSDRRRVSEPITSDDSMRMRSAEAPLTGTHTRTQPLPALTPTTNVVGRSASGRHNPTVYNSSHKSQLPAPVPVPVPEQDVKVHRRSMGGILNQHRDEKFERDAHVLTHTPSVHVPAQHTAQHNSHHSTHYAQHNAQHHKGVKDMYTSGGRSKRESYPPHPAIVGAGPGSPYSRGAGGGVEPRNDAGGYFSVAGHRNGIPPAPALGNSNNTHTHNGNNTAGVGAKYLGRGRYAGDRDSDDSDSEDRDRDDEDEYTDEDVTSVGASDLDFERRTKGTGRKGAGYWGGKEGVGRDVRRGSAGAPVAGEGMGMGSGGSADSFVPPKTKSKWKIWR
ncbi:hypothetical protein K491DRAFT_784428 [Lophiostoma macrostomum CBS 122681]|uniref:PhoD-like phosphatase domain-containing protein n=1 Tax=Lophiostoma macrostomum CBS 122681 TaxID=1314788 RepID=A0A6A6SJI0_9PLEO|nr:hypothetical protein K491DRAFT_784428 [Lophiostoma macrostomum CBS 122681]